MLNTTGLSVVSAFRVDDDKVNGGGGAISKDVIDQLDGLRKSTKSKSQKKSRHLGNSYYLEEL